MSTRKTIALIGAISLNGVYGIGRGEQGRLAWRSKLDMDFFRQKTTGNTVVMGRGTWQSLPEVYRPLPDRINVVVTNNPDFMLDRRGKDKGVIIANSIKQAIEDAKTDVFVIGSFDMWNGAAPLADELLITLIGINVDTSEKPDSDHPEFVHFSQLLNPTKDWPQFKVLGNPHTEIETPKTGEPFSVKFLRYARTHIRGNDRLSS